MNRRISVLVVDDEPRILRFVRTELESDGYRVLVASSGRQAIELHDAEHPALVILDLIMPDLDGFEVLRRIRVSARTPVIVLTARASDVRQDPWPGPGRGRLPDQAVQPGGAVGPDAGGAAAICERRADRERATSTRSTASGSI